MNSAAVRCVAEIAFTVKEASMARRVEAADSTAEGVTEGAGENPSLSEMFLPEMAGSTPLPAVSSFRCEKLPRFHRPAYLRPASLCPYRAPHYLTNFQSVWEFVFSEPIREMSGGKRDLKTQGIRSLLSSLKRLLQWT